MLRALENRGLVLSCLVLGLVGIGLAEQSVGLQADMLGRGISYRTLSASGLGGEFIGYGRLDLTSGGSATYRMGLELRFLKFINPANKLRIYLGAGAGLWATQGWYETWEYYDDYTQELRNYQGVSLAFLGGADWKVLSIGDESALAISFELQAGYYSRPGTYYPYYWDTPYAYVSPGVGAGIRYVWE